VTVLKEVYDVDCKAVQKAWIKVKVSESIEGVMTRCWKGTCESTIDMDTGSEIKTVKVKVSESIEGVMTRCWKGTCESTIDMDTEQKAWIKIDRKVCK
jgi:hypothetical protein